MRRRSWVAAAGLVILLGLLCLRVPGPTRAVDLTVVSEDAVADFPTGITLTLDYDAARPVDAAYVLYTLAHQEIETEVAAVLPAGDDTSATAEIEMAVNYVPAGVDLTYRWRLVSHGAADVDTVAETITWRDDRFDWERTATDEVEVFGYEGGAELREEVLASAQETVDRLSVEYGVTVDRAIRIWVYASKKDFDGTLAANSQEWAAGAAYPDLQLILAVIPEDRPSELGRIIPHEVSHQVFAMATANPYNIPATWLDEGLAVVSQTNGTGQMTGLVERAKRDGDLLPLASITSGFPYDPDAASLAYAEAFSVVSYLVGTYGEEAVAAIGTAYRAGNTHDDVLRQAIGRDVAQLDAEWRATIGGTEGGLDRETFGRLLIYGVPGLGVVAYLVVRAFHRPLDPFADEEVAA